VLVEKMRGSEKLKFQKKKKKQEKDSA